MKTALQGLIEELEMMHEDEYYEIAKSKLRDCLISAKSYLDSEKEQIQKAYNSGLAHEFGCMEENKYYNETFKK